VQAAGSFARIYTNEYNVFQWGDEYGNWYRQHIDDLRDAGGAVSGVGFQYYADPRLTGSNTHSAARMQKALMGLSVQGLPLSLTEFGLSGSLTADQANTLGPVVMDDSMRMMFGTPLATSFLIWGWWDLVGNPRPPAGLLDNTPGTGNNDVLTPMGVRWQQLMSEWDTNVSAFVDSNGAIGFTGFYGDYTLGGQAFALNLKKGTTPYTVNLVAPPTWSIWKSTTSGAWGGASNWQSGGVANAAGQTAYFGPAAAARAVTVDANRTVGMLAFDSANSYTLIPGGGTITMRGFDNATGHRAAIYVVAGSHAISAPLVFADDTAITVALAGSTLTISNLQPMSANVAKAGAGTLVLSNIQAGGLAVSAGVVRILAGGGSGTASRLSTLSIASGARLDLTNNKLITDTPAGHFTAGAYTGIQGEVQRAYNFGAWDQPGMTTSMPQAGPNAGILSGTTTIGVATAGQVLFIEPSQTGTFMGQTVMGASTIAMYTYAGDLNFDGLVDGADYGVIDNYVQFPGTDGYVNGDFNYDGVIDGADYGVIDNTIQLQGDPFPGVMFGSRANGASLSIVTSVPEPASLGVIGVAAANLLGRRRGRVRG
jgi:autotransporter-associated beta strand protein